MCTGVIRLWSYRQPAILTVASGGTVGGVPQLVYGDGNGATYCSTTPPPAVLPACPPGIVPSARAFTEGNPKPYYAGMDWTVGGAPLGRLFDPLLPVGGPTSGWGPHRYAGPESDLAFDWAGGAAHPLVAEVKNVNNGKLQLAWVSRSNGAQFDLRPAGGRAHQYDGLAFDGFGRLWGDWQIPGGNNWNLDLVNITAGTGQLIWPILPGMTDLASTPACGAGAEEQTDLGDAPDSTNHAGQTMTAYSGVQALFPSVRDTSTGTPAGPFHRLSGDSWLGVTVTYEADADQFPDQDQVTNIDPASNVADRDGADDGVTFPIVLPPCQLTQFQYTLQVAGPQMDRYVNVWFDFNRNGQWGDQIQCSDQGQVHTVDEWAVHDQRLTLGPGTHVITTPAFRGLDVQDTLWMRTTLAETTAPGPDGSGYEGGYELGETEDDYLHPAAGSQYQP